MKPRRTARRLPRYTLRKVRREGHAYFFNPPSWARAAGCPVRGEPLGSDYAAAVERAESVLLPAFDSWRSGGVTDAKIIGAVHGTLDWLFGEYRNDRRYTGLGRSTQANHEYGFRLVGGYLLKDGRRLGEARLSAISAPVVDAVFEKLLFVTAADGSKRERRTCVNMAMKSCRRAWNVAARRHPGKVGANPFASMGLVSSSKETPTATYAELQAFRTKAVELGFASLATASLVGWEWLQRRADIFGTFDVAHYRPKEQPDAVRVLHEKTKEEAWIPLFDAGGAIYPELMAELDAIKRERIGGLMIRRDWGDQAPWPTASGDLSEVSRAVKQIIRAAGLREELSFTSFRHGGHTEAGDGELTDAEIRAVSRHKSAKVLPRYVKRTMKQVAAGARKRRATREGER